MEYLQARILEWVAFPFSRGSSQPRDWTQVSHMADRFFTIWATREATYSIRARIKCERPWITPPAAAAAKSLQSCPKAFVNDKVPSIFFLLLMQFSSPPNAKFWKFYTLSHLYCGLWKWMLQEMVIVPAFMSSAQYPKGHGGLGGKAQTGYWR